MKQSIVVLRVNEPIHTDAVPCLAIADFQQTLSELLSTSGRIAAYFGCDHGKQVMIIAVVALQTTGTLAVLSCIVETEMPSQSSAFPQLQLFEREIAEQYGIRFTNHPWFKAVRFQPPFPGRKALFTQPIGITDFFSIAGEEVHEVAVGPVHAGVIEPGHFRFQCHGETVYHLEISLGYQHRGIENLLIGGPHINTRFIMETAAGDTTIGHTLAYCQIMESLLSCDVPPRAHALRGIALELERCANHIGDIGALSGDVGYLPTASYCGRIRGDVLNTTALVCGSRFGRSFACPGGVLFPCDTALLSEVQKSVTAIRNDFTNAADLLWDEPSVLARFEDTGPISKENGLQLGLVGPAARACGILSDVRQDFPSGIYQFSQIPLVTHTQGDVFSRAFVRYSEVIHSLDFIEEQCKNPPDGIVYTECSDSLKPRQFVVSLVEGWRGEVCHIAMTDKSGRFSRYKIVDPSFHNWSGLALALQNQQISDFPLCNKSFNLSYCGFDL